MHGFCKLKKLDGIDFLKNQVQGQAGEQELERSFELVFKSSQGRRG